mgnify:CR=1 FL=1
MNYDLNIWDHLGYITEYEQEGWRITVHAIPEEGAPYGSGDIVAHLDLTLEEADRLGLRDGNNDSDFFMDLDSFVDEKKDVPVRVGAFLTSLDEKEGDNNELLSVWQELSTRQG